VALRCAQQYWRTPSYIYPKATLTVGCLMLIGFSFFNNENTMQGLQNQMFGVFIFLFIVSSTSWTLTESEPYTDDRHRLSS
jgi:ATP-binding cassette subfamily G (WHITE) protein 2 (PDR)